MNQESNPVPDRRQSPLRGGFAAEIGVWFTGACAMLGATVINFAHGAEWDLGAYLRIAGSVVAFFVLGWLIRSRIKG